MMNNVSVLIIAHNEEENIARCIESVLNQTQKATEIVVVCHNCTDGTETIAKGYSEVTALSFVGPAGITHARMHGLAYVHGDIVLCIDGDSYASRTWIQDMTSALGKGAVLVATWVKFVGNTFSRISNIWNRYSCVHSHNPSRWVWGASFGFWAKDKSYVEEVFKKIYKLSQEIGLSRNVDDYWLALHMQERGSIRIINTSWVTNHTKEHSSIAAIRRNRENNRNALRMETWWKSKGDILHS